jgi:hypothetical protein
MIREKEDYESLSAGIRKSHTIVSGLALLAVLIYVIWFWLARDYVLSNGTEAWGQFGDYMGGLLNPLVAYAAFYWLTRSVSFQKQELAETRAALEETSASQERQANSVQTSVRVAALSSLINSIMGEVQIHRQHIQFVLDQANSNHVGAASKIDGTRLSASEIPYYLRELNDRITQRMTDRFEYEEELKQLLAASRGAI